MTDGSYKEMRKNLVLLIQRAKVKVLVAKAKVASEEKTLKILEDYLKDMDRQDT